ncbi:MAG: IS200/IS605 family transposase [Gemmatimonadota bacterium]
MAHSFVKMRVHLLWATKHRRNVIEPEWRPALFRKLASIPQSAEARVLCVGGVRNHVHLLLSWSPSSALSCVARDLKTWSSRWIRKSVPGQSSFSWQAGYSAFTVYHRNQSELIGYLLNQERHHGEKSRVGGWLFTRRAPQAATGRSEPSELQADLERVSGTAGSSIRGRVEVIDRPAVQPGRGHARGLFVEAP